jgi:predicted neutral ceramidase superfamily lipid hydrolase
MNTTNKPGTGFWIVAVIALLWNLIGILFWATEYFLMTDEMKATLPPEQLEMMNNAPAWGMWVYAVAVFGGTLASVLLLMRKKLSVPLFLISLLAILVQMGYWIFGMDSVAILGPESLIMPLIVIAIAIFLYFYSKGASKNGWLS